MYLLRGAVGVRPLALPLLVGKDRALLIDTGCAADVAGLILPALRSLQIPNTHVGYIINTHCDSDHQGGNAAAKAAFSQAILGCGAKDRAQIENPEEIWRLRYDAFRAAHHHHYSEATRKGIMASLGQPQPVDVAFHGGEFISLEPGWSLEIVSLPGHSAGHLGILDHRNHILFAGDALHGAVYKDFSGRDALCPTYLDVPAYRETVFRVKAMPITRYVGCHWPIAEGAKAIQSFCNESLEFVRLAESKIIEMVSRSGGRGVTLSELCQTIGPTLGGWPSEVHHELCYAFAGHLRELTARGMIRENAQVSPYRYYPS